MSDEFDKEAEREKLRKKFAKDEQEREHTQRMSELLLQGATMTNRHCDDCGDPIFRKDGQAFCPRCHTVDAADVQQDDVAASPTDHPSQASGANSPMDADTAVGANSTTDTDSTARANNTVGAADPRSQPTPSDASAVDSPAASFSIDASDSLDADRTTAQPGDTHAAETTTGDLHDARRSLVRTVTRFARTAEQTEDPRRAREHLQAAREAAEALAVLEH